MTRFARSSLAESICVLFEARVREDGDRLAIKGANAELTYRQLNRAANRLAHALLSAPSPPRTPVALFLEQGLEEVIAVLGVLKAGRPYVALSPSSAPGRLTRLLEDSTADHVVVSTGTLERLRNSVPAAPPAILLDAVNDARSTDDPRLTASADSLACIIYTSGSTGEPKGVMQTHRTILHRVLEYTDGSDIGPDDRVTLLASCSYSMSLRQVFGALLSGATVCAFDVGATGAGDLAPWVSRERITLFASVPAVFRQFAGALSGTEDLSALRIVRLAGEAAGPEDVALHRQRLPSHCAFEIALASNETGTIAEWFVDRSYRLTSTILPCGFPPNDKEVWLVDEDGGRVAPGAIGEILVRSRYLSPGYWRRPDLTRAAFLPDPDGGDARIYRTGDLGRFLSDGRLEPCGRRDFRVKIRGQQVPVAEVEAALVALGIKQAVVVARDDTGEGQRLIAYVVPRVFPPPTVSRLRRGLSERLPQHMIPSAFVVLDAMPLTERGKVDREALPSPPPTRPELDTAFVAPRTPVEEALAEIWAKTLRLDRVGVNDHFIDLGGHSLLATRIVSRAIEHFAADIPVRALFEAPTVAAMAVVIVQCLAMQMGDDEISRVWAEVDDIATAGD